MLRNCVFLYDPTQNPCCYCDPPYGELFFFCFFFFFVFFFFFFFVFFFIFFFFLYLSRAGRLLHRRLHPGRAGLLRPRLRLHAAPRRASRGQRLGSVALSLRTAARLRDSTIFHSTPGLHDRPSTSHRVR